MRGPGAQQMGSGILTGSLAGATNAGLASENVLMAILEVFFMVKLMTRGDQCDGKMRLARPEPLALV